MPPPVLQTTSVKLIIPGPCMLVVGLADFTMVNFGGEGVGDTTMLNGWIKYRVWQSLTPAEPVEL